jgi:predicted amidohydrolase
MERTVRVAAVQLDVRVGDVSANMNGCETLALRAVAQGAKWIALPEFFNTGVAFLPALADRVETEEGPAAALLRDISARHGVMIGGSFLCRIDDGSVRNRYLAFADGTLVGRHDKDLPTMWENAFYEGGDPEDAGVLGSHGGLRVGAAVCWEFMRTMTARRLRCHVDVIMGGSCWWSLPDVLPGLIRRSLERDNGQNAIGCIQDTARLVGAPVIHGAHCGRVDCGFLGLPPLAYRGHFKGGAAVVDGTGRLVAFRSHEEGQGIVTAEIPLGSRPTSDEAIPHRFWLRSRGALPTIGWHYQGWLGRLWYRRNRA